MAEQSPARLRRQPERQVASAGDAEFNGSNLAAVGRRVHAGPSPCGAKSVASAGPGLKAAQKRRRGNGKVCRRGWRLVESRRHRVSATVAAALSSSGADSLPSPGGANLGKLSTAIAAKWSQS